MSEIQSTKDEIKNTLFGVFNISIFLNGKMTNLIAKKIEQIETLIDDGASPQKIVELKIYRESGESEEPEFTLNYMISNKGIPQIQELSEGDEEEFFDESKKVEGSPSSFG